MTSIHDSFDSETDLPAGLDDELDLAAERPSLPIVERPSGSGRLVAGIVVGSLALAGIISAVRGSADEESMVAEVSEPSAPVVAEMAEAPVAHPEQPAVAAPEAVVTRGKERRKSRDVVKASARPVREPSRSTAVAAAPPKVAAPVDGSAAAPPSSSRGLGLPMPSFESETERARDDASAGDEREPAVVSPDSEPGAPEVASPEAASPEPPDSEAAMVEAAATPEATTPSLPSVDDEDESTDRSEGSENDPGDDATGDEQAEPGEATAPVAAPAPEPSQNDGFSS